jgi:hypothetical protein
VASAALRSCPLTMGELHRISHQAAVADKEQRPLPSNLSQVLRVACAERCVLPPGRRRRRRRSSSR